MSERLNSALKGHLQAYVIGQRNERKEWLGLLEQKPPNIWLSLAQGGSHFKFKIQETFRKEHFSKEVSKILMAL